MNTAETKNYPKRLNWSAKQISVLLTIIALLLWSHSILYARFEVGYLGLIHGLPVTFFIALAFLIVASATLWTCAEGHGKLLCLQLLILISALWLLPEITGGSPTFNDHAYRNLGFVDYISRQGHFSSREISYLSWPGVLILFTTLSEVLSANFKTMVGFFPFLMQLLYILPLYVFLKNTLGPNRSNYCWAGAWLFSLANWQGNEYLSSASGAGLFLLLTLLALVTMPAIWERSTRNFALLFLVVCVFAALAMTHLLTTIGALSIMAALTLVKKSKRMISVTALCVVLFVSWNLTGAAGYTKYFVRELDIVLPGESIEVPTEYAEAPSGGVDLPGERSITLAPNVIVKTEIIDHLSGSESHIAVNWIRILFSAMFAMIGIVGAIAACLTRHRRNVAISVLTIALGFSILIVIPYGARLLSYLFVFLLAPMAYFGARLLDMKKKIVVPVLCFFLFVSGPLHVIAHYGNQAFDYFPQTQANGLRFSYAQPTSGQLITSDYLYLWAMKTEISGVDYPFIPLSQLQWQDRKVLPKGGFQDSSDSKWIYIMRRTREEYNFLLDEPYFVQKIESALANSVNCNLIYYNPDFKLYFLEPF